jgi:hypothetical protein
MARSLDQIYAALGSVYDPQVSSIQKRQDAIPNDEQAQEQGLSAQQNAAFDQITDKARSRGLGFSGIPLSEQAQYNATDYMPALANLKKSARDQVTSLEDAILGINERRQTAAQGISDNEQNRDLQRAQMDEQKRQFDASQALDRQKLAASGSASNGLSGNALASLFAGGGGDAAPAPKMAQRKGGGFNFTDANGQTISAAKYAQLTGTPLGNLLQSMGASGDNYAAQVFNQIKAAPWSADNPDTKKAYSSIFWGT